jgi:hypothetical protein
MDLRPGAPASPGGASPQPSSGVVAPADGVVQTAPNEIVIRRGVAGPVGAEPAPGMAN